jgi:signal transduction histidine kinase
VKVRLLFFLYLLGPVLHAQNRIDSLLLKLVDSKNDTVKVDLLCALSGYTNGDSSLTYAREAHALAEKLGFERGIVLSDILIGKYYYFNENYSNSLGYFIKAFGGSVKLGSHRLSAIAARYIGYNHFQNDRFAALEYYKKSIEFSRLAKDELLESYALSAIGNLYESWQDGKQALDYYLRSLDIRKRAGSPDEVVSSLIETARAYNRLALYDKSVETVLEAKKIAEAGGTDKRNLMYICQMIGHDFADRKKDYKMALTYFLKAYDIAMAQQVLSRNEIVSIAPVADMYQRLGDYKKSAEFYQEYFRLLAENEGKINKQLYDLQDSLKRETARNEMLKKDAEIYRHKSELERERTQKILLVGGILLLLLSSFFIYRGFVRNRKLNVLLETRVQEKTQELQSMNEQLALSEERLKEANKELESFVYKASHDLKGPIVSAKGLLQLMQVEGKQGEGYEYVQMLSALMDKEEAILASLHELSLVRQGSLVRHKIDLAEMVRKTIDGFRDHENWSRIRFTVNDRLEKEFHSDEILLNTILRNVIENAIKYSRAGIPDAFVEVDLLTVDGFSMVRVSDNGIGIPEKYLTRVFDVFFRATDAVQGTGLGLYIVKNALLKLKGEVKLLRSPHGQGTVIELYFPH